MKHVQTPRPMNENMNDAYFAMTGGIWNSRKPVPGVFTAWLATTFCCFLVFRSLRAGLGQYVPRPKRTTYMPMMIWFLY